MRVGLTGGIASGKSTVLAHFKKCGAAVIDADVIARQVVEPGTEGLQRIVEAFGAAYVRGDGTLDRAKLGQLIFADEAKRKALNALLHPLINADMRRQMVAHEQAAPHVPVLVDIPLLIENDLMHLFERIVLVYVPLHVQLERLMARNALSETEARLRIAAQMSLDEKKPYADYVVDNSADIANTKRQVEAIWDFLCRESGQVE